jgi:hypothetical protein
MINSDPPPNASGASEQEAVDAIVQAGPGGAMWLAGLATAVVSYIRTSWGNRGAAVTAAQANELRSAPED